MNKILQSEDFNSLDNQADDLKYKPSPLKGSTTFRVEANTPNKIESEFRIGGGAKRWIADAKNMERVSRMFEIIDDDMVY